MLFGLRMGLGTIGASILFGIMVLLLVGILVGGIFLKIYVEDEIEDDTQKNVLLTISYIMIGLGGLGLFILLLPYIIQYVLMALAITGISDMM